MTKIFNTPVPLKLIPGKLPALSLGALILNALYAPQDSPIQTDDALSLQECVEAEHVLVFESPVGGVGPPRQDTKHRHNIERALKWKCEEEEERGKGIGGRFSLVVDDDAMESWDE